MGEGRGGGGSAIAIPIHLYSRAKNKCLNIKNADPMQSEKAAA